jgi:hypothetical protein
MPLPLLLPPLLWEMAGALRLLLLLLCLSVAQPLPLPLPLQLLPLLLLLLLLLQVGAAAAPRLLLLLLLLGSGLETGCSQAWVMAASLQVRPWQLSGGRCCVLLALLLA